MIQWIGEWSLEEIGIPIQLPNVPLAANDESFE